MPAVSVRTARKPHLCIRGRHTIAPGDRYLRHVRFPSDDFGPQDQPSAYAECIPCRETYEAEQSARIAERYDVHTFVGQRVVYGGKPGVITGYSGGDLLIKLDEARHPLPAHPMWNIEYLEEADDGR